MAEQDWDEVLITNNPESKEIEVSFKKIDGDGFLSRGDEPGTPAGVTEDADGCTNTLSLYSEDVWPLQSSQPHWVWIVLRSAPSEEYTVTINFTDGTLLNASGHYNTTTLDVLITPGSYEQVLEGVPAVKVPLILGDVSDLTDVGTTTGNYNAQIAAVSNIDPVCLTTTPVSIDFGPAAENPPLPPDTGGEVVPPTDNPCESFDCTGWEAFVAGDFAEDTYGWADKVIKIYATEEEIALDPDRKNRCLNPTYMAANNITAPNRGEETIPVWKNFKEGPTEFYEVFATQSLADVNGSNTPPFARDWDLLRWSTTVNAATQLENPGIDGLLCGDVSPYYATSFMRFVQSDLALGYRSPSEAANYPEGLGFYPYMYTDLPEDQQQDFGGFIMQRYGFGGAIMEVLPKLASANDDPSDIMIAEWDTGTFTPVSSDLASWSTPQLLYYNRRRNSQWIASVDDSLGSTRLRKYVLPTANFDVVSGKPTNLEQGIRLSLPIHRAELAVGTKTAVSSVTAGIFDVGATGSFYIMRGSVWAVSGDSGSPDLNKYLYNKFDIDLTDSNGYFKGWISLDVTARSLGKGDTDGFKNEYRMFDETYASLYVNGDVILNDVPFGASDFVKNYTTGADVFDRTVGAVALDPGDESICKAKLYGTANSDTTGNQGGFSLSPGNAVGFAFYTGPDALDLPRSTFGRRFHRQAGDVILPEYCNRVP